MGDFRVRKIRDEISETEKKIIMYTGTLETYQGIPLLLESLKLLDDSFVLALVGGKEEQIKKFKTMAEELTVSDKVKFMGIRPSEEILFQVAPILDQCWKQHYRPKAQYSNRRKQH